MKNISDIIDDFGGPPAFAKFFKVERQTVYTWRRRNFLPPDLDTKIIAEARRREIGLTFEDLAIIRQVRAPKGAA